MDILYSIFHGIGYILPFLLVLSVVVVLHELGHYWAARWNGVGITDFSVGFGPELFGITDKKGTRWKLCLIPLGGFVKMLGDSDAASRPDQKSMKKASKAEKEKMIHLKKPWQKILVSVAGPIANFITAMVFFTLVFTTIGKKELDPVVGQVIQGGAADVTGMKTGDRILSILPLEEGKTIQPVSIHTFRDIMKVVRANLDHKLIVKVDRQGVEYDLIVQPRRSTDVGTTVPGIGIMPTQKIYTVGAGLVEAVGFTFKLIGRIFQGLYGMIAGSEDASSLGGMFSIAKGAKDFSDQGLFALFEFIAVLSVSLGVLNLLPVPMLDGGHVLFCAIEWIRGRPVPEKIQEISFKIGLYLLLALMIFAHWNDVKRFGFIEKIVKLFS
ncbi:MAG: RIP metalloprotease RseP [Alphaproteobacteria bacterium]|nr:MAG: RIP metalloprotease RseP [Alphaproteobacteria bacterium]